MKVNISKALIIQAGHYLEKFAIAWKRNSTPEKPKKVTKNDNDLGKTVKTQQ